MANKVASELEATKAALLFDATDATALKLAPVRVNLIAAGFVDTPLSASLLGDQLDEWRNQLRATLPIRRVVGPSSSARQAFRLYVVQCRPSGLPEADLKVRTTY